jgi:hypothetical protein
MTKVVVAPEWVDVLGGDPELTGDTDTPLVPPVETAEIVDPAPPPVVVDVVVDAIAAVAEDAVVAAEKSGASGIVRR